MIRHQTIAVCNRVKHRNGFVGARRAPTKPYLTNAQALCIEITVQDTGLGIHLDHLSHIFKPFRQGDQTSKRRHSGTGLGLAIAHFFVSMMEGFITVESQVGEGTKFVVRSMREILNSPSSLSSGELPSIPPGNLVHPTNEAYSQARSAPVENRGYSWLLV